LPEISTKGFCCNQKLTHRVTFHFGPAGLFRVKLCDEHYGNDPYDEYVISDETIGDTLT